MRTIPSSLVLKLLLFGCGTLVLPTAVSAAPTVLRLAPDRPAPGRRPGYTKQLEAKMRTLQQQNLEFRKGDPRSAKMDAIQYAEARQLIDAANISAEVIRFLGAGGSALVVQAKVGKRKVAIKAHPEKGLLSDTRELKKAGEKELAAQHLLALPEHKLQIFQYVGGPSMESVLSARSDIFNGPEFGLIEKWWGERLNQTTTLGNHDGNYIFEIKTGQIYLIDHY